MRTVTPMTYYFIVTFKHIPTRSLVLISVKHSLLKAEQSPLHLDRLACTIQKQNMGKDALILAHLINLPDGTNLCSLFISKVADAEEKANLLVFPLSHPLPCICLHLPHPYIHIPSTSLPLTYFLITFAHAFRLWGAVLL